MTQQEHLFLIRAKCVELLELAKQRTPGRWQASRVPSDWGFAHVDQVTTETHRPEYDGEGITLRYGGCVSCTGPRDKRNIQSSSDAAFIASAAGPFEAALASTVAAIDGIIDPESSQTTHDWSLMYDRFTVKQIIASWPLELLQQ